MFIHRLVVQNEVLDLSLMRYYDIVDRFLKFCRSQPLFGAAGINMVVAINTRDSFWSSWAMTLKTTVFGERHWFLTP
jgi:hypothetical protein